jgi:hypothetical protein
METPDFNRSRAVWRTSWHGSSDVTSRQSESLVYRKPHQRVDLRVGEPAAAQQPRVRPAVDGVTSRRDDLAVSVDDDRADRDRASQQGLPGQFKAESSGSDNCSSPAATIATCVTLCG